MGSFKEFLERVPLKGLFEGILYSKGSACAPPME